MFLLAWSTCFVRRVRNSVYKNIYENTDEKDFRLAIILWLKHCAPAASHRIFQFSVLVRLSHSIYLRRPHYHIYILTGFAYAAAEWNLCVQAKHIEAILSTRRVCCVP